MKFFGSKFRAVFDYDTFDHELFQFYNATSKVPLGPYEKGTTFTIVALSFDDENDDIKITGYPLEDPLEDGVDLTPFIVFAVHTYPDF